MPDDLALGKEQVELLSLLVGAARKVARDKRGKFLFVETFGGASMLHPGLSGWSLKACKGDIEVLAQNELLSLSRASQGSAQFDITPRGFKYYDERGRNSEHPISKPEMIAAQLCGLDEPVEEILREILSLTQSTGRGVDAPCYRAQHDVQLDVLDRLEKNGCLRKEQDKYWVSLCGLGLLDDERSRTLIENFEKIFFVLRQRYKENPRGKVLVTDLAQLSSLTYGETVECLGYMGQAYWWDGWSSSFDNPVEAFVQPSEKVLRHKSFKDLSAGAIRLQSERGNQSTQPMSELFLLASPRETHKEVDRATNLTFVHPDEQWVIKELEKLMLEWADWLKEVDQIIDQPYDANRQSDVFVDGESMMQKHEILQARTLVFLNRNVRGHGFITGFDGSCIDRTDLRLKYRVKHRIQDLRVLYACLGAIQSEEKVVAKTVVPPDSNPSKDIFQLKPTFFGVGIDLKALWRKWRSKSVGSKY